MAGSSVPISEHGSEHSVCFLFFFGFVLFLFSYFVWQKNRPTLTPQGSHFPRKADLPSSSLAPATGSRDWHPDPCCLQPCESASDTASNDYTSFTGASQDDFFPQLSSCHNARMIRMAVGILCWPVNFFCEFSCHTSFKITQSFTHFVAEVDALKVGLGQCCHRLKDNW